jgi:hypothetical protein
VVGVGLNGSGYEATAVGVGLVGVGGLSALGMVRLVDDIGRDGRR